MAEAGVYQWPQPKLSTERWRYMTLRECRKALEEPLSEWDARARLKKGFKENEAHLIDQLKSLLTEMVKLEDNTLATVQRVARKSLIMWLDFEMHRCRVVLLELPTPGTAVEKVNGTMHGSLRFTLAPGLGRYGNANGNDLENFTQLEDAKLTLCRTLDIPAPAYEEF